MFERYTEKARRVIFFARYEASTFGSPYIETEHILLGILREDKALTARFVRSHAPVEEIRLQVAGHTEKRETIPTSVDLPLSNESKRVLAYAAEEAQRLNHKHIGSEHLFLGLLREAKSFAAELLNQRGVKLDAVREELAKSPHPETESQIGTASRGSALAGSISDFTRDLTQAAMEDLLDPFIGREQELDALMEVLCRRYHRSALLIGERGAGKSAIVEGLAQRIADGNVPAPLLDKRVKAMDAEVVAGWVQQGRNAEGRLNQAIKVLIEQENNMILFVDDLDSFLAAAASSGSAASIGILKHWLWRGRLVCVGTCTAPEYQQLTQTAPWVRDCFTAIHVHPLDEPTTIQVLQAHRPHYEKFHNVTYADDALELAVSASARYLPHKPLPGRALELLDAAGARVSARRGAMPEEIHETMKRLKFIVARMDSAVLNHEFEKARFYSDEERKERENLRELRQKHPGHEQVATVTRQDVENVIAQWSQYPFQP